MRAEDRGRWATALAAARKRWKAGEDRARIAAELDALWAELQRGSPANDTEPAVGPRFCALPALLRYHPFE